MIRDDLRSNVQAFSDGVCAVYGEENVARPGGMPAMEPVLKGKLCYEERTVGMARYAQYLQQDVEISRILRVPRKIEVSTQDVVVPTDGKKYRVKQVQYPREAVPPCMDLSLERIDNDYGED